MKTQSKQKTATVAEMIHRFRTAPATSSAIREAMRQNLDAPSRMWYEYKDYSQSNDDVQSKVTINNNLATNHDEIPVFLSTTTKCKVKNKSKDHVETSWRYKFKNGL